MLNLLLHLHRRKIQTFLHNNLHCLYLWSLHFSVLLFFYPEKSLNLYMLLTSSWICFYTSVCISFLKSQSGTKTGAVSNVASALISHPVVTLVLYRFLFILLPWELCFKIHKVFISQWIYSNYNGSQGFAVSCVNGNSCCM